METVAINIDSVKDVLHSLKQQGQSTVTTAEVIQEYHLTHRKFIQATANRSYNSVFGKLLRENESDLGIRYVREVLLHDREISLHQSAEWVLL